MNSQTKKAGKTNWNWPTETNVTCLIPEFQGFDALCYFSCVSSQLLNWKWKKETFQWFNVNIFSFESLFSVVFVGLTAKIRWQFGNSRIYANRYQRWNKASGQTCKNVFYFYSDSWD